MGLRASSLRQERRQNGLREEMSGDFVTLLGSFAESARKDRINGRLENEPDSVLHLGWLLE